MATDSSILAWKIPWTEEPGGLPSVGSQSRTRLKQLSSSSSRGFRIFDYLLMVSFISTVKKIASIMLIPPTPR